MEKDKSNLQIISQSRISGEIGVSPWPLETWLQSAVETLCHLYGLFAIKYRRMDGDSLPAPVCSHSMDEMVYFTVSENRIPASLVWPSETVSGLKVEIEGDWSQGARRTFPQTEPSVTRIRWYELPALCIHLNAVQKSSGKHADYHPCDHRLSNRGTVLCLSNDLSFRRPMVDSIHLMGWSSIGMRFQNELPDCRPQLVLCDDDSMESKDRVKIYSHLRRVYPNAIMVSANGFPRWTDAELSLRAGCNYAVGKLVDLESLLELTWRFSSAALPRI